MPLRASKSKMLESHLLSCTWSLGKETGCHNSCRTMHGLSSPWGMLGWEDTGRVASVLKTREGGSRRKVAFEWFSEDKPTLFQKRMKKVEELKSSGYLDDPRTWESVWYYLRACGMQCALWLVSGYRYRTVVRLQRLFTQRSLCVIPGTPWRAASVSKGADWLLYCFNGSYCLHRQGRSDGLKGAQQLVTKLQARIHYSCLVRIPEKSKQKRWWERLRFNLGIFYLEVFVKLVIKVKWRIIVCLKCLRMVNIVQVLGKKTVAWCYCHFHCNQLQHCGCHSNQYISSAYFTSNTLIRQRLKSCSKEVSASQFTGEAPKFKQWRANY